MSDYDMSLEKRLKSFLGRRRTYYEDSDDEDIDDDDSDKEIEKDIQKDSCIKEKFSFYSNFHGNKIRKRYGGEKIKSGLRVIRSRSWTPPNDYILEKEDPEIGTIINVAKGGVVKVQWDSSDSTDTCKKGENGQFNLLLLDNAQIGVMHLHVQCDGCGEHPLRGIRWKCRNCANYDLCTSCYMDDEHDVNGHTFKRIQSENAKGEQMISRSRQENYTAATGIGKGAIVKLRSDDKHEGIVQELLNKKIDAFRSDAKVKWNDSEGRYAVGTDGKCDLKFRKEGKGLLYYADHLPVVSSDSAFKGLRVVRGPAWKENNKDDGGLGYVGTIVKVHKKPSRNTTMEDKSMQDQGTSRDQKKKSQIVDVQWDNGNIRQYDVQNEVLRILDNGPLGVEHEYCCDICNEPDENKCIKGFRWQCLDCEDYNLCHKCYMEDKHEATHRFQRVVAPNKWEQTSTFTRENSKRVQSYGIFKGAQVVEFDAQISDESTPNEATGKVTEICNCKMDNGRSEVEVKWSLRNDKRHETTSTHDILELQSTKGFWIYVYHEHLPILGKGFRGYFDVDFVFDNTKPTKKIKVTIWRNIQQEKKVKTFKPSLFIVFADHPEVEKRDGTQPKEDNIKKLVEEVMEFAKKTRLPCLVAGRKVMFYGGSSNSVFIHYKTDKDIIQELVKKGFKQFERGDVAKDEDDIQYFQRMAEYVYGETVLPVIISLRKGAFRKQVMRSAAQSQIPIIRFKKHSFDVTVLTPVKFTNNERSVKMTEHNTNVKNPWSVQKSKSKFYDIGRYDNEDDPDEIAFLSEGPSDFKDNFDAIICY
ncbi:uncharacterized protein LOC134693540 [Mytilus trossulus]|uniref:uncharacterized protein LOC134693540 n=1 Tax=Mytilus trossulus TaxID=6551 RepID=UPI0030068FCB